MPALAGRRHEGSAEPPVGSPAGAGGDDDTVRPSPRRATDGQERARRRPPFPWRPQGVPRPRDRVAGVSGYRPRRASTGSSLAAW